MTDEQRCALRLSQERGELNKLIEKRNASRDVEPTAEEVKAMEAATARVHVAEVEHRAAIAAEDREVSAHQQEPEERERNELLQASSLMPFVESAVSGRLVTGREAELRAAVLGDGATDEVPWSLLLPPSERLEHRADAVTPVAASAVGDGTVATPLERVFTRSVARRLGVSMPSVGIGTAVYPVMTAGTTATMVAADTAVDAAAGTFEGFSLGPTRLTGAYLFRVEDTYRMRGYEGVLRRDLSAVLTDAMDNLILNGNSSTASEQQPDGFYSELTAPTNPGAATTWDQYFAIFTGKVNGIDAYSLMDLRSIMGATTYQYAAGLARPSTQASPASGPRELALDYVGVQLGGQSVSSRVPAAASNIQTNVGALTSYPGRNAVAPVWAGFRLIVDPYTGAAKGQVRLTALMLWNFKIIRETGYFLWKVRTA